LRHKIVKELLENRVISLDYVKSKRNITNPLMKGVSRKMVFDTSRGMRLRPIEEL